MIPEAASVTLHAPFTVPHTFCDDIVGSDDGSDALIVATPSSLGDIFTALRTMGWEIPPGTSQSSIMIFISSS
jgi:hypothetical protein